MKKLNKLSNNFKNFKFKIFKTKICIKLKECLLIHNIRSENFIIIINILYNQVNMNKQIHFHILFLYFLLIHYNINSMII